MWDGSVFSAQESMTNEAMGFPWKASHASSRPTVSTLGVWQLFPLRWAESLEKDLQGHACLYMAGVYSTQAVFLSVAPSLDEWLFLGREVFEVRP